MHDVMSSRVPFVIPYSILWNFLEKFGIGSQLFSLEILLAYLLLLGPSRQQSQILSLSKHKQGICP